MYPLIQKTKGSLRYEVNEAFYCDQEKLDLTKLHQDLEKNL
jgi:hypothetical protein